MNTMLNLSIFLFILFPQVSLSEIPKELKDFYQGVDVKLDCAFTGYRNDITYGEEVYLGIRTEEDKYPHALHFQYDEVDAYGLHFKEKYNLSKNEDKIILTATAYLRNFVSKYPRRGHWDRGMIRYDFKVIKDIETNEIVHTAYKKYHRKRKIFIQRLVKNWKETDRRTCDMHR